MASSSHDCHVVAVVSSFDIFNAALNADHENSQIENIKSNTEDGYDITAQWFVFFVGWRACLVANTASQSRPHESHAIHGKFHFLYFRKAAGKRERNIVK